MNNINVLIYGATGGIGRAVCVALRKKGAQIYLIGRVKSKLKRLAEELNIPESNTFTTPSLTENKDIKVTTEWLKSQNIDFDIGLHCAGIGNQQKAKALSLKEIKSIMDINLISAFTFYSIFSKVKNPTGYELVYIGSASTDEVWPKNTLYGASKAGLEYFAQSLQKEVVSEKGRIWLYKPGSVNTGFFNNLTSHLPTDKMIQPQDLASFILKNFSLDRKIHLPALSMRTD